MLNRLPPTFDLAFDRPGRSTFRLSASQILPLPRMETFIFFEDPRNLFDITPDWLRFVMKNKDAMTAVSENAEFDYTIKWFGITMPWKSRIVGYKPPEQFTDVQLVGPYRSWRHLHTFEEKDSSTLMRDTVTYRLPFGPLGDVVHAMAVRRQLEDIFRYRAKRIDEWARGVLQKKSSWNS